ncbi:MAG: lytic transglycosylase domain-containing protein, partial [Nitrospirae bacterium]
PYEAVVRRAAAAAGLDPELVHAVVAAESGYDPRAVSPRGAVGLMQLMPETARRLGVDDPFDPEANLFAGCRYLRALWDRFGDLTLALAAYNAGPDRVARLGAVPPFAETRAYLDRIRRRYPLAGRRPPADAGGERLYCVVLADGARLYTNVAP